MQSSHTNGVILSSQSTQATPQTSEASIRKTRSMKRAKKAVVVAMVTLVGCAPIDESSYGQDEQEDLASLEQDGRSAADGLTTINGLTSTTGLISANGLSTSNGLTSEGTQIYINGLNTATGLLSKDGTRGLLRWTGSTTTTENNYKLAQYVVRCALDSGDSLTMRRKTSATATASVTLSGQLGLAPKWKAGLCDAACQEKVSACVLAHGNSAGTGINVVFTANWVNSCASGTCVNTLGKDKLSGFGKHEAVFFGNIFQSPPSANIVAGYDWTARIKRAQYCEWNKYRDNSCKVGLTNIAARSCASQIWNYSALQNSMANCAIKLAGSWRDALNAWKTTMPSTNLDSMQVSKCDFVQAVSGVAFHYAGTATVCSGVGSTSKSWGHPITVWREDSW